MWLIRVVGPVDTHEYNEQRTHWSCLEGSRDQHQFRGERGLAKSGRQLLQVSLDAALRRAMLGRPLGLRLTFVASAW